MTRTPGALLYGVARLPGDAWTRNPSTEAHAVNTAGEKERAVGRADASRGRLRACSSRPDRDTPAAARKRAARRHAVHSPPAPAGRGRRVTRAAQRVLVPPRSPHAAGVTHLGRVAKGGTARARPAAIATRRRRHTHGPHGARPPPAPAGECRRIVLAAHHMLGPPRSRRAAAGTHMGGSALALHQRWKRSVRDRTASALRRRWLGRGVATHRRHSACPTRRDRDAPRAARTWAARRAPSVSAGWGGPSRRAGGTARACPVEITMRRRLRTHGPPGAHPPRVPAEEGSRVARAAQCVLVPPRSPCAACGTHMGRAGVAPAEESSCVAKHLCSAQDTWS